MLHEVLTAPQCIIQQQLCRPESDLILGGGQEGMGRDGSPWQGMWQRDCAEEWMECHVLSLLALSRQQQPPPLNLEEGDNACWISKLSKASRRIVLLFLVALSSCNPRCSPQCKNRQCQESAGLDHEWRESLNGLHSLFSVHVLFPQIG